MRNILVLFALFYSSLAQGDSSSPKHLDETETDNRLFSAENSQDDLVESYEDLKRMYDVQIANLRTMSSYIRTLLEFSHKPQVFNVHQGPKYFYDAPKCSKYEDTITTIAPVNQDENDDDYDFDEAQEEISVKCDDKKSQKHYQNKVNLVGLTLLDMAHHLIDDDNTVPILPRVDDTKKVYDYPKNKL